MYDLVIILPWVLSCLTITHQYLAGSQHRLAWHLALATEVCWFVWSVSAGIWGLIPMSIFLIFVYLRNARKNRNKKD
jgi:hypothetical protein